MFYRPITEIFSVIFTIFYVFFKITEIPSAIYLIIYHPQFKVINLKLGYKKRLLPGNPESSLGLRMNEG